MTTINYQQLADDLDGIKMSTLAKVGQKDAN